MSAPVHAERGIGLVELKVTGCQQQGNRFATGAVGQLEDAIAQRDAIGPSEIVIPKNALKELYEPSVNANVVCVEVTAPTPPGIEGMLVVSHLPVSGEFVLEAE